MSVRNLKRESTRWITLLGEVAAFWKRRGGIGFSQEKVVTWCCLPLLPAALLLGQESDLEYTFLWVWSHSDEKNKEVKTLFCHWSILLWDFGLHFSTHKVPLLTPLGKFYYIGIVLRIINSSKYEKVGFVTVFVDQAHQLCKTVWMVCFNGKISAGGWKAAGLLFPHSSCYRFMHCDGISSATGLSSVTGGQVSIPRCWWRVTKACE